MIKKAYVFFIVITFCSIGMIMASLILMSLVHGAGYLLTGKQLLTGKEFFEWARMGFLGGLVAGFGAYFAEYK